MARTYSTREGTIGKGEEGVGDEVVREKKALEAPGHLNEKEKEIWGLLMDELNCSSLEVSIYSAFFPLYAWRGSKS